jgi:hypothetical protein
MVMKSKNICRKKNKKLYVLVKVNSTKKRRVWKARTSFRKRKKSKTHILVKVNSTKKEKIMESKEIFRKKKRKKEIFFNKFTCGCVDMEKPLQLLSL